MNLRCCFLLLLACCGLATGLAAQSGRLWYTDAGRLSFTSDAPLELISATSRQLQGILNPADGSFAFAVAVGTFEGFNSPLQREHFNENYLETDRYPRATFRGKLIEQIDFSRAGVYQVRAKGILHIHGMEQERIIRAELTIAETDLTIQSAFTVLLQEHRISIPKVVKQKIAEEIYVDLSAVLQAQVERR